MAKYLTNQEALTTLPVMMTRLSSVEERSEPVALGDRAMEDLRFIRQTMERGAAFTAVPGWGGVWMGVSALVAAVIAADQPTPERWIGVWALELCVAVAIGSIAMQRKARRARLPVLSGAGRKFLLSFLPPATAGAVLTVALWRAGAELLLPGAWLLLYGAAVVTAGTFSVKIVPVTGLCFMAFGVIALLSSAVSGNVWMGLGFGGLHILFGTTIARRHGG